MKKRTEAQYMVRIGLVLGAGFAKGAYQYGALKALLEYVPATDIERVSASSVGALNGIGFCSGQMEYLQHAWNSIGQITKSSFIGSVLRSPKFAQTLTELAGCAQTLETRLYIALANVSDMTAEYCCMNKVPTDELERHVRAAVCMPGFNKSVMINGKKHIDGGWFDNIPVYPLQKYQLDYIIVIHFDKNDFIFESELLNQRIVNVTFPDRTMFSNALFVRGESIELMMNEGYAVGKAVFSELFANGAGDLEYIYSYIKKNNSNREKPSLRLTTDVVISNINRLTKKITHKKEIADDFSADEDEKT
ncbi:MAG TPA: hypothetical protein PLT66_02150 [Bacillota bacterium]|nr:hypothetical protein [Bacillota bacterium]